MAQSDGDPPSPVTQSGGDLASPTTRSDGHLANPVDGLDVLVGRRVALRYRIGERAGRPLYTDAVGELAGADTTGTTVVVHTRRGPVRVERTAVVAVRSVPPAPPRRPSWSAVARLETLCADAWPAQTDVPLGAWRLRAAGGFTGRANSALAIGDPGMPVPAALETVRAFGDEQAIPARVQAPVGSPWDRAVAAQGWVLDVGHEAGAESAVLVGDLERLSAPSATAGGGVGATRIELAERPDAAWWELALGHDPTAAQRHVLDPGGDPRTAFGLAPGSGAIRATVVADHLHLSRLTVLPRARRGGVATALTAAAAAWGRAHGARWAVLQVALHNTAARELYTGLGCVEHHRYRYLRPG
ncbi:MAG: GNAT family N-acetyltransferase [Pseudonocardia sp.]